MSSTLSASTGSLLEDHDVLLLDLDGVVYVGPDAVPHATEALQAAVTAGLRLGYITNNASRTPATVAAHLRDLGAPAADEDVVNSAQAAASHLAGLLPAGAAVLLVGGDGLRAALTDVGLRATTDRQEAVAVVQGFSPDLGWAQLAEATHAVRAGLPWVATNLDATVPTPGGPAPGNGLLVDLVARAAGRAPDVVCGKPERALFDAAVARLQARAALVVGDRLDTDLQGARTAGLPGLLVLTGVTGVAELLAAAPRERPDFVSHDLRGLADVHPGTRLSRGGRGRGRELPGRGGRGRRGPPGRSAPGCPGPTASTSCARPAPPSGRASTTGSASTCGEPPRRSRPSSSAAAVDGVPEDVAPGL